MEHRVEFDETVSRWANGAAETHADGQTVRETLYNVAKLYPAFRLFNCEGEMRSIVKVSRNGATASLDEPLDSADTLRLSVSA